MYPWLRDGSECWLLIHVEIQGTYEKMFPERMFRYNVAAYGVYNQEVVSLAVLCDDNRRWRPDHFEASVLGCKVRLDFLTVKLLDYRDREEELERAANPFAAVVLAQLKENLQDLKEMFDFRNMSAAQFVSLLAGTRPAFPWAR